MPHFSVRRYVRFLKKYNVPETHLSQVFEDLRMPQSIREAVKKEYRKQSGGRDGLQEV